MPAYAKGKERSTKEGNRLSLNRALPPGALCDNGPRAGPVQGCGKYIENGDSNGLVRQIQKIIITHWFGSVRAKFNTWG